MTIPACAGETWSSSAPRRDCGGYPRLCGGNRGSPEIEVSRSGLSPRVRGKRYCAVGVVAADGTIPACAGETSGCGTTSSVLADYPRVCGGNRAELKNWPTRKGPSPRVQGKRHPGNRALPVHRAIPACAGETVPRPAIRKSIWVYPRVCGGNRVRLGYRYQNGGLSPRLRGKRPAVRHIRLPFRAIPACAGKTGRRQSAQKECRVYPRVCGGNLGNFQNPPQISGLSPRVRGKSVAYGWVLFADRSIPACAGETFGGWTVFPCARVYPRVCGGNTAHTRATPGQSPRPAAQP